MEVKTVEERLAAWADLVSFLFLGIAILIGGIAPRRRVWGRSLLQNMLLVVVMTVNVVFSAGRFIAEGILVETGPREFLLISVIYSARWIWLLLGITLAGTKSAKAFQVARALRELKTLRLGPSTKEERRDQGELVIRRGKRIIKGEIYWRGVEEYTEYFQSCDTHLVRLVEKELHSHQLDEIGTVEFKKKLETESNDGLYKRFYDLVRTVDAMNPNLVVDYSPFLTKYGPVLADTRQAQRVAASDTSDLGQVARRVAADACYYIWHPRADFRTKLHVEMINQCLEGAAASYLGTDSMSSIA